MNVEVSRTHGRYHTGTNSGSEFLKHDINADIRNAMNVEVLRTHVRYHKGTNSGSEFLQHNINDDIRGITLCQISNFRS